MWYTFVLLYVSGTFAASSLLNTSDATVGPSPSTIYCQKMVYLDAINGTYDAIDKPVDLENFDTLSLYGDVFEGVTPVVLDAGVVTPAWTDTDGNERGQAVLWIPDDLRERGMPRVLYVHGGGWTSGSPTTDGYAPFGAKMAKLYSMPVLMIDYTLAPIGNFSVMLEEVGMAAHYLGTHEPLDIAKGIMDSNASLPSEPVIFVSGDSAGGGTALSALVAQASPGGLPGAAGTSLAGGVVFSPWVNLESDGPTYYSQVFGVHEQGDVLLGDINFGFGATPEDIVMSNQESAKLYSDNLKDPVANPMYAPSSWLKNLAPISLHVGMPELLQSDATIFAMKAASSGAERVESHTFDGMWHVFEMYSQGCGSGSPLILADSSLNFSKQFYDDILLSKKADSSSSKPIYCNIPHYEYPLGQDSAQGVRCSSSSSSYLASSNDESSNSQEQALAESAGLMILTRVVLALFAFHAVHA